MQYRPKVYTASKLHHATLWRLLRDNHPEIEFTSRWIEHEEEMEANATPADFAHYWTMDAQDVERADFVLLYSGSRYEKPDELRGALVEAGMKLGGGGVVLAVGLPSSHSWSFHPRVVRFLSLDEAFDFLHRYYVIPPHKKSADRGDFRQYEGK